MCHESCSQARLHEVRLGFKQCSTCSTIAKKWNVNAILWGTAFVSMCIGTDSFALAPLTTFSSRVSPFGLFVRNEAARTARRRSPVYGQDPLESVCVPRIRPTLQPPTIAAARSLEDDDVVLDNKNCIRCPATSLLNWREYRARLIKVPPQHRAPSHLPQLTLEPHSRRARRRS
jgi:hypothetical protein